LEAGEAKAPAVQRRDRINTDAPLALGRGLIRISPTGVCPRCKNTFSIGKELVYDKAQRCYHEKEGDEYFGVCKTCQIYYYFTPKVDDAVTEPDPVIVSGTVIPFPKRPVPK
jgi:hypothetical protein